MSAALQTSERPDRGSTQFIITVDRTEKQRWKLAADGAGLSMAEYVRRAVQQASEAPTAGEIAEARALAAELHTVADRIEKTLDGTLARIEATLDPAAEAARRTQIMADLAARGLYLDLDALAGACP